MIDTDSGPPIPTLPYVLQRLSHHGIYNVPSLRAIRKESSINTRIMYWWISWSILYHRRMWHPEEPPAVTVCVALVTMRYGTSCLLLYQMIKIINKHIIHICMCHSGRSRHIRVSGNILHVSELLHDVLRQMMIHQTWIASQPSRIEDNVVQGTHLTVSEVRMKMYVLYYQVVKIHTLLKGSETK